MNSEPQLLFPDWPDRPAGIRAAVTLRGGGCSQGPWASLNLGAHVEDDPECVAQNRQAVAATLDLPREPAWLQQVHGTRVVCLDHPQGQAKGEADAAYTRLPGVPLCILTADCLPVLIADAAGQEIGAAHAGWRSLCGGVLENLVSRFTVPACHLTAWLGPAIGPRAFEVGPEVRTAFVNGDSAAAKAFRPGRDDRWLADIYALARLRLQRAGLENICGGEYCTVSEPERFYSYRRDGRTGRMAALIWRSVPAPE